MTSSPPLPDIDEPLTAPFWAAALESRLTAQRCPRCAALRWPPLPICPECLASGGDWTDLTGLGTLWSYAVYHRAMHPAFAGSVPYTVAMIDLPEGLTMIGQLADTPCGLHIGQPVQATFQPATPDVTLILWAPTRPAFLTP